MKIGIVGAENSHTVAIAKTLNIEKAVPGVEVTTSGVRRPSLRRGRPRTGRSPTSSRTGRYDRRGGRRGGGSSAREFHLPAAKPFVEAGVPVSWTSPSASI